MYVGMYFQNIIYEYMHIYAYACLNTCTQTHMYMYTSHDLQSYIFIRSHKCIHKHVCVCVCVCVHVCVCVYVCVRVFCHSIINGYSIDFNRVYLSIYLSHSVLIYLSIYLSVTNIDNGICCINPFYPL